MSSILSAYIDESGSTNLLDREGENRFYVSTAIVVNTSDINLLIKRLDDISASFNNGAEFKSAKIGKKVDRRRALLKQLAPLPFRYFSLVVDKQRMPLNSGWRFRSSYYKNINNHLYTQIENATVGDVDIYVDQYGDHDFEASCIDYFEHRNILFARATPHYVNDKSNRLIQLADIVSGTLRQYYFGAFKAKEKKEIASTLKVADHEISVCVFPPVYTSPLAIRESTNSELDSKIAGLMLEKTGTFIEHNLDANDDIIKMQVKVLQELIDAYTLESGPLFSDYLLSKANNCVTKPISKQRFHSEVIGGIRRQGIVLTGIKKGYKLAVSEKDINAYLDFDRTVILPMLSKLHQARTFIKTNLNHDILSDGRFKELTDILSAYQNIVSEQKDQQISGAKERDEGTITDPCIK